MKIIHLRTISTYSNYKFQDKHEYCMVIINKENIHKIYLPTLINIKYLKGQENVLAQYIKSTIKVFPTAIGHNLFIHIFEGRGNKMMLLFSGTFNLDNYDEGYRGQITLYAPSRKLWTNYPHTRFRGTCFLEEQFYNQQTYDPTNYAVIQFELLTESHNERIHDYIVIDPKNHIWNRYEHNYITENEHNMLDCNLYNGSRIKLGYRPIITDPYHNDELISPIDGRIQIKYLEEADIKRILTDGDYGFPTCSRILSGNIYKIRSEPQDYNELFVPYSGNMIKYVKKKGKLIIKVQSNYFIPKHVGARDLMTAVYGNYINPSQGVGAGLRHYPELKDVQPDTTLVYYVVVISDTDYRKVNYSFEQLTWLEQGQVLIPNDNVPKKVFLLFNRKITASHDIYNMFKPKNKIDLPYSETYVRARDSIGIIN